MPYSDQEIKDYAYKLQGAGAPISDIEKFIKLAKQEQITATLPESFLKKTAGGVEKVTQFVGEQLEKTSLPEIGGGFIGTAGGLIGGVVGGLAETGIQSQKFLTGKGFDVKKVKESTIQTAKETAKFGEEIGIEGIKQAPFAGLGKVPQALLVIPAFVSGIEDVKKGNVKSASAKFALSALAVYGLKYEKGKILSSEIESALGTGAKTIKEGLKPLPTFSEAVGQVGQGKIGQKKAVATALQSIETKGVKTYFDLSKKLDAEIPKLSKQVDEALEADPTPVPIDELSTTLKSKSGTPVKTNYVESALTHLKEFYEKTGDVAKKQDVEEMIQAGVLTRKQVNDISRQYNVEFGGKAFSPQTGEPLTSVNAQMFENTRSGLKGVARESIGGTAAKEADAKLSAIYDTKKLIERNVEAVNKLKQKIEKRGWIAKGTYSAIKLLDTLSLGALRGATDAILSRGTGLKTLNALDIEKNLEHNLKIIKKALKQDTEEAVQKILQGLKAVE